MRQLADTCGVSVPTLYNTFGGKQELLLEAVQPHATPGSLHQALDALGVRGHERLLALLQLCGNDVCRRPRHYQRIGTLAVDREAAQGLSKHLAGQICTEARRALLQMREDETLADWADPDAFAQRIASNVMIICMEWAMGDDTPDGEAWQAAFSFSTAALVLGVSREPATDALLEVVRRTQQASLGVGFVRPSPIEEQS